MPENTIDPSILEPRYRGAFARLVAKIRAEIGDELVPVDLDVMSAVRTTEGIFRRLPRLSWGLG